MSNLCKYCGQQPKFGGFDYCSKTCGAKAKSSGPSGGGGGGGSPANSTMCEVCHQKPKFKETNSQGRVVVHPYCGRTCASKTQAGGGGGNGPPKKAIVPTLTTQVIHLDRKDPKHGEIVHQFDVSWRHSQKPKPSVIHVYKVVMPKAIMDRYFAYRDGVERRGNFESLGLSTGNECRRWHGTKRGCTLGDDPKNLRLCGNCALCGILTTSFKLSLVGSSPTHLFSRFGNGIYASSTSSKSDDYTENRGVLSPNKVMILTKVVVGKGYKLLRDKPNLTAPPPGYNSVLGETGKSLNHDEVIVYKNDAIRPAYLVVYR